MNKHEIKNRINIMGLVILVIAPAIVYGAGNDTNFAGSADKIIVTKTDPYYSDWGRWELKPLEKARKQAKALYRSDFSRPGLTRWWLADDVVAVSKDNGVVVSLSPKAAAAGRKWGILWYKVPVITPFAVQVEFTMDPACPHDANLFWGQNVLSKNNLGKEQECYLAGYFGWGGKSCGIERASDWQTFGITGALDSKPGVKRTGVWIVEGKLQCMYLDGTLVLYTRTVDNPPLSGYFGLGVFMSRVTYHSVKVFKLNPASK
ncbi:hypothetical protein ACFLQL_01235 [Verrucomicrobiota bacterium]